MSIKVDMSLSDFFDFEYYLTTAIAPTTKLLRFRGSHLNSSQPTTVVVLNLYDLIGDHICTIETCGYFSANNITAFGIQLEKIESKAICAIIDLMMSPSNLP